MNFAYLAGKVLDLPLVTGASHGAATEAAGESKTGVLQADIFERALERD